MHFNRNNVLKQIILINTLQLSSSTATSSNVIPTINWLTSKIAEDESRDEHGIGTFTESLRSELAQRFSGVERSRCL